MFGVSRHRPGLQVARRSKRRIVAVIAGVVVAAIVIGEVAADVVDSSGPASVMGDRTYATAVIPLIDESTSLVAWLKDAREQAPRLGRLGVDTALGRLVAGSSQVQEQLAQLDREIMRCLKRYIAREVYKSLVAEAPKESISRYNAAERAAAA